MQPVLFTLGSIEVKTMLIGALFFAFVYVVVFWITSRKELKSNTIFDIAFLTLLASLISGRLLAVLSHLNDYLDAGFNLFPIHESESGILLFSQLPWSFLNFTDGHFEFIGVFMGIIIGLLVIYQNSNQRKSVFQLFDRIIVAYVIAGFVLFAGMMISGTDLGIEVIGGPGLDLGDGLTRHPVNLYRMMVHVIFLAAILIFKLGKTKKNGLVTSLFLIIFGASEFIVRGLMQEYSPLVVGSLDYHQIIAVMVALIGVLFLIAGLNLLPARKRGVESEQATTRVAPGERKARDPRRTATGNINRFSVSFSDRLKDIEKDKEQT
ncbi:MAG: prolipoprotein diacylglyceryl transferase family protein [Candidatus Dojkabacteria bacterium]